MVGWYIRGVAAEEVGVSGVVVLLFTGMKVMRKEPESTMRNVDEDATFEVAIDSFVTLLLCLMGDGLNKFVEF